MLTAIKACLDHWSLGFGYCLSFVIWGLEFIKFMDPAVHTDCGSIHAELFNRRKNPLRFKIH